MDADDGIEPVMEDMGTEVKSDIVWYAYTGELALVRDLLDTGSDLEERHDNGETPLIAAAWGGRTDVVAFLMGRGANVNATTKSKWTPLHAAASGCHLPVVRLLLSGVARINDENLPTGRTSERADPTLVDINNKTAFTIAQEKNNAHIADAIRIRLNDLQAKKLMADAAGYHEKDDAGKDDRACASCSIS